MTCWDCGKWTGTGVSCPDCGWIKPWHRDKPEESEDTDA